MPIGTYPHFCLHYLSELLYLSINSGFMKQTLIGICKAFSWVCSHYNLIGMLGLYAVAFTLDKLTRMSRPRIIRKETFNSNRIYDKGFGVGVGG